YQGTEARERVIESLERELPIAAAFVDMRMPPGWDGLQTIEELWDVDPRIQVVLCTAYTDYSWSQLVERLGHSDQFLVLKKPFDQLEVVQIACALTEKWKLARQARAKLGELEKMVFARTCDLQQSQGELRELNRELERAASAAQAAQRSQSTFL